MNNRDFVFLTIKRNVKRKIYLDEILCCLADNTYTEMKLCSGISFTVSKPLSYFNGLLPNHPFLRISRSGIVNLLHVVEIDSAKSVVTLTDGTVVDSEKKKLNGIETAILSSEAHYNRKENINFVLPQENYGLPQSEPYAPTR